jgi:hypothetical protein
MQQSTCAILCCDLWPVLLYRIFPHYLINCKIFGKTSLNVKYVFWFSLPLSSQTFLILRRIWRDIIINVFTPSYKVVVILLKLEFLDRFSNNTQIWNFMKIRPVEAEFFDADGRTDRQTRQTDRQTDMTKLMVIFRNFVNAPNMETKLKSI